MKLLLIVAHGSRLKSSNDEIIALVDSIKEKSFNDLVVEAAFLELVEPSILQSVQNVITKENITEIDLFPYFLAAGKHVKFDIPNEIDEIKKRYPQIKINLLPHLGKNEGLINLILSTQSK